MDIQVIDAASVPNAPAGTKTLFIDSSNNNLLSWKDASGVVTLFTDDGGDCCACEIAKEYADGVLCALNKGLITATDFQAIMAQGFTARVYETNDGKGNTSCVVNVGGDNIS